MASWSENMKIVSWAVPQMHTGSSWATPEQEARPAASLQEATLQRLCRAALELDPEGSYSSTATQDTTSMLCASVAYQ